MNNTRRKPLFALISSFMLIFSSLFVFSTDTAAGEQKEQESPVQLAPLYGKFDIFSSAPTNVLVELTEPSILEAKQIDMDQSRENLEYHRTKTIENVKEKINDAHVIEEYDYVFSGFALQLPSNRIPDLLTVSGVQGVYADVEYTTANIVQTESEDEQEAEEWHNQWEMRNEMTDSAPYIGAREAWEKLGLTGKGIKVAVLDTGVDYDHPDLASAFEEDYKGWDAVDNNDQPQETKAGDPRGEETRHGTHVAGMIAGDGLIKGIAPGATLLAYRVLGPGGVGRTAHVLEGIERAAEDKVDIMNLSIEHDPEQFDWAAYKALNLVANEGVLVVTSNGNQGPTNWTTGSPGLSSKTISVGASQLPYQIFDTELRTSGNNEYGSVKVMGFKDESDLLDFNGQSYEFVHVGLGEKKDYEGKDVQGKIALIRRGELPFVEKAQLAHEAGAIGAIIYNHTEGDMNFNMPGMPIPTFQVNKADGLELLAEYKEGKNTVQLHIELVHEIDETMASFSSRGPVSHVWEIKPDVVAPGVNMTSTVPDHDSEHSYGYASFQGTSVAAPQVAGAAALLMEAQPDWGVAALKAALMNTAESVTNSRGKEYAYNTQGAGSIRVAEAIQTETLVIPGSHSFGSFAKDNGKQTQQQALTIRNLTDEEKHYSFYVAFKNGEKGIDVDMEQDVRVAPQSTEQVRMNVQVDPEKLDTGYYEGTILVYSSTDNGEYNKVRQEVEVPAILFVTDAEELQVTEFALERHGEGKYDFHMRLPKDGIDHLEFWIYGDDPFAYTASAGSYTAVSEEEKVFEWEEAMSGPPLSPGTYHVYAYVEKDGQAEIVYGGSFEKE